MRASLDCESSMSALTPHISALPHFITLFLFFLGEAVCRFHGNYPQPSPQHSSPLFTLKASSCGTSHFFTDGVKFCSTNCPNGIFSGLGGVMWAACLSVMPVSHFAAGGENNLGNVFDTVINYIYHTVLQQETLLPWAAAQGLLAKSPRLSPNNLCACMSVFQIRWSLRAHMKQYTSKRVTQKETWGSALCPFEI